MGLISRVSSRTYRSLNKPTHSIKMFAIRRLTTSAARKSDPIQAIFVGKIKEYSKLASAGKLDQAEVNAEIDAAKARLGATGDMQAFPKMEFSDPDFSPVVDFKLQ